MTSNDNHEYARNLPAVASRTLLTKAIPYNITAPHPNKSKADTDNRSTLVEENIKLDQIELTVEIKTKNIRTHAESPSGRQVELSIALIARSKVEDAIAERIAVAINLPTINFAFGKKRIAMPHIPAMQSDTIRIRNAIFL